MSRPEIPPHARGYERFPGRIGRTAEQSQRAWPRERRAPSEAPNVIMVVVDDLGFSDIGPFGCEVPTPHLDRVAASGYRFTNYHSAPVCSPARAALMTGLNPHRAGFAHVANHDAGFPNLRLELQPDANTLPEVLRGAGYATFAVGKWHLTRDALMNDAADKSSWPCQRGFDRYYGSLEGCNSFFHPNRLVRDNSPVSVDDYGDDYYLTDDLTDQAIAMITSVRGSDSRKPFFLYFAHHAMHGPLGAKPDDLAAQRGKYDVGWDAIREARLTRQVEAGLFPEGTPLPPPEQPPYAVPAWQDLSERQRAIYARHQEVYAAMITSVDDSLGRLLETVEQLGELDNTIVVFTSDNGGTAEGGPQGTRSYFSHFLHGSGLEPGDLPRDWDADVDRDLELMGGPRTMIHYPRGWGRVSNTPFRFYKGQTFAGGVRVPMLVSWPRGLERQQTDDGIRKHYQYVTDVMPTLLDLIGIEAPAEREGLPAKSIDGHSFRPVLHTATSASTHREQYAEFGGNRGYYRDGWKLVTNHAPSTPYDDSEWELYDVEADPNELHNVAAEHPELVQEMAHAWEHAAWANTVFPMSGRQVTPIRRPSERELERGVRLLRTTPTLERYRASRLVTLRSFTIDIDFDVAEDANGYLIAHGDQGGGYAIGIEGGHLFLTYNEYGRMRRVGAPAPAPGAHVVRLEAVALPELKWRLRLLVDGVEAAQLDPVWMLLGMAPFSGIDVGICRGGPVDWEIYERRRAFPYRGVLRSVIYTPGEPAPYDRAALLDAERDAALVYD